MAFTYLADAEAASGDGFGATTAGINTTGATLIVFAVAGEGAAEPPPSDSGSNTWTALTQYKDAPSAKYIRLYYTVPTSVGAAHTFTATAGTKYYPAIAVIAFSGGHASPLDSETGNQSGGASLKPGSRTPSVNDCVLITALNMSPNVTATVDLGYTQTANIAEAANNDGVALAYLIQTSAAASDPEWNAAGGISRAASHAVFKPSTGGGGTTARALAALGVG